MTDLPTGHPDDQVIELGYSDAGWQEAYAPGDTLQSIGDSSERLADIYAAYPESEFYVIGHSLGGVVALDGLARYSGRVESDGRTHERGDYRQQFLSMASAILRPGWQGLRLNCSYVDRCQDWMGFRQSGTICNSPASRSL